MISKWYYPIPQFEETLGYCLKGKGKKKKKWHKERLPVSAVHQIIKV
jgi:hypothetical protein